MTQPNCRQQQQPSARAPDAPRRLRLADRVGATGSLVCALHCALWPLLIALVPTLGLGLAGAVTFERGFTLFATALALSTLVAGYRHHRMHSPLLLLLPGLAAVWYGAFGPIAHEGVGHAALMATGGLMIGAAHLLNIRLAHRHEHVHCAHGHSA